MSSYQFYIYTKDALVLEAEVDGNIYSLSKDFDFTTDRYRVMVQDDDTVARVSGQAAQIATVLTMDGRTVCQGLIDAPVYDEMHGPNGAFFIDRIELDGLHIGYAPSEELMPGVRYSMLGTSTGISAGAIPTFMASNSVPCFCEGALIETEDGPVPIEEITIGQKVLTLDHGAQPVLWAGRFSVSPLQLSRNINLYPVTLSPNSIGPDCPSEALSISGNHQILLSDAEI